MFQQPAVVSCQQLLGHMDLSEFPETKKKTPHTSLFFLFFVFHPHSPHLLLGSFGAGWVPKSQKSGGCSATSTSVIMSCLAFQGRVSRNCHIWYSTPAQSVFLCPPCRISHLKYSGGCRNALINTVALQLPFLCIYEAEPSRFGPMTDLTMC